jgi:predicted transcriptional regulator
LHKRALMQYLSLMLSYMTQLETAAKAANIQLLQAFRQAGVPTSTYYRTLAGKDLRFTTAKKVLDAIRVHALQQAQSD